MGTLGYTATISLDGYVADANGDFNWSGPSDEVFQYHVDRMAAVSTEVLGRNTYLLMKYWAAEPEDGSWGESEHEFARLWHGIERVVVSETLTPEDLAPERERLVPTLGLGELRRIVDEAPGEVEIFGHDGEPGHPCRHGRGLPVLHRPEDRGRGPERPARRCAARSRTRRAPDLQQRRGLPPLPGAPAVTP